MPRSLDDLIREALPGFPEGTRQADLRAYVGFEGTSDDERQYRLYLSPDRREYVEVERDRVQVIPLGGDESPHVLVLVPKDVQVDYVTTMSQQVAAEFLSGTIAERHLAEAALTGPGGTSPLTWWPTVGFSQGACTVSFLSTKCLLVRE